MSLIFIIMLFALIGVGFYSVAIYNTLQRLKTQIMASIQEIGNQLKRQASLIPNLQESTKAYLSHEKGIFEMISQARLAVDSASKSGQMADIEKAVDQVQSVLPQLRVLVESNPELKGNTTVEKFMNELTDTADKLMYARRTLIDLTQAYNEKLLTFPSNLIANLFGFQAEKGLQVATTGAHLEVDAEELKETKVDLES